MPNAAPATASPAAGAHPASKPQLLGGKGHAAATDPFGHLLTGLFRGPPAQSTPAQSTPEQMPRPQFATAQRLASGPAKGPGAPPTASAPGKNPAWQNPVGDCKDTQSAPRVKKAEPAASGASAQTPAAPVQDATAVILDALAALPQGQTVPPGSAALLKMPAPETGKTAAAIAEPRKLETAHAAEPERPKTPGPPEPLAAPAQTGPAQTGPAQTGEPARRREVREIGTATAITREAQVVPEATPAPEAPVADVAPSDASAQAVPPTEPPTKQVAHAISGLTQSQDGTQSVTVTLRPESLGQVRIRIDQTQGGAAQVAFMADKPETLRLLQHDQPKLMQALDQAGVGQTGRTVTFEVTPPDQVGASAARPDSMETAFGDSRGHHDGGPARGETGSGQDPGTGGERSTPRPRWFRAGLDITA